MPVVVTHRTGRPHQINAVLYGWPDNLIHVSDIDHLAGEVLDLRQRWTVGELIGMGGFGRVYALENSASPSVAKFVPKVPGSTRELLFVDLDDAVNVVPIIDSGEHGDFWVLVMPRAERSLRDRLDSTAGVLDVAESVSVLLDVSRTLESLEGGVVHRDLKPDNVLLLEAAWCLADFGIARYAEASTAPDTRKYSLTPQYSAPERWRLEHATSATDLYSLGVMGYEMIAGELPFQGPSTEDFREQHLHQNPPSVSDAPVALSTLISECMFKAPEARPTAANIIARLGRVSTSPTSGGLADLAEANRQAIAERTESARTRSEQQTDAERRSQLGDAGRASLLQISESLSNAIRDAAPSASYREARDGSWSLSLMRAELTLRSPSMHEPDALSYGDQTPAFGVVLSSEINLRIPRTSSGWEGRSHSLWYCDSQEEGVFGWFETAFMVNPMVSKQGRQDPFALDPGQESAQAISPVVGMFQLAWPFTYLDPSDLESFIGRWSGWLAAAARGELNRPTRMPERDGAQNSFRRN